VKRVKAGMQARHAAELGRWASKKMMQRYILLLTIIMNLLLNSCSRTSGILCAPSNSKTTKMIYSTSSVGAKIANPFERAQPIQKEGTYRHDDKTCSIIINYQVDKEKKVIMYEVTVDFSQGIIAQRNLIDDFVLYVALANKEEITIEVEKVKLKVSGNNNEPMLFSFSKEYKDKYKYVDVGYSVEIERKLY